MVETAGQPVHELGALEAGDTVHLSNRPRSLTVIEARVQHARLEGPRGGEHILSDWMSADTGTGEFRTSDGRVVRARCLERADGTEPTDTIGMEVNRDTPTGGLSTAFTTGGDFDD